MAFTTVSWLPGTSVCFGMHRFIVATDGSVEWVQPAASPLPPHVTGVAPTAGSPNTELGGSSSHLRFGVQNAAQIFECLALNVLAPPSDEFVGILDYDHESLHDVLDVQEDDSSFDSGSHHPSQECFMADTS